MQYVFSSKSPKGAHLGIFAFVLTVTFLFFGHFPFNLKRVEKQMNLVELFLFSMLKQTMPLFDG